MRVDAVEYLPSSTRTMGLIQARDVLTDPPTTIWISSDPTWTPPPGDFCVTMEDIEPTEGLWMQDNKNQLSICFMRSFGKCTGKSNGQLSSCQQVHIRRNVLDALRRQYTHPQRSHFFRTVKLLLDAKIKHQLQVATRRPVSIQYLEFRSQDVQETLGLQQYEQRYRQWLQTESSDLTYTSNAYLCWSHATYGACECGHACQRVHAHLPHALTRDRAVLAALEMLSKRVDHPMQAPPPPPPPPPPMHSQMLFQSPMTYILHDGSPQLCTYSYPGAFLTQPNIQMLMPTAPQFVVVNNHDLSCLTLTTADRGILPQQANGSL